MGFIAVYDSLAHSEAFGGLPVQTRYLPEAQVGEGKQFVPGESNFPLHSVLNELRGTIVAKGGAPEAVRLLDTLVRFDDKEKSEMAAKLSKKSAPAETKPKAAAKPAAKGAAKPKGNTEALAKAREQRAAKAAENRKYKHLVKLKDVALREGSWTQFMVTTILSHTTTDDAKAALAKSKEFGAKKLDFTWAEKKGYIAF